MPRPTLFLLGRLVFLCTTTLLLTACRGESTSDAVIDADMPDYGALPGLTTTHHKGLQDELAVLLSERAVGRGIFERAGLQAMLEGHQSGQADLGHALWTLLTFELWMQRYFD